MFGNCAGWRICRRAVHVMPVWIRCCCGGTHGHCEHFMPIGLYVRRHGHELPCVQPRRFVYYVCASEYYIQRQHWFIRIRPGLRNGIDHPAGIAGTPPQRGTSYVPLRGKVPLYGGVST